jgi:transcriptional regulator with XRE-family HTH domain
LTQRTLAANAGVSQSVIARVERGGAGAEKLATIDRIASALGATTFLDIRYRGGLVDRLVDRAHAQLVEHVSGVLRAAGWIVELEFSFNVFGERGSVDVLAWHPATKALLIIECKSGLHDLQALLHALGRKLRLVPDVIRQQRGWDPVVVGRVVVVTATSANRRLVETHRSIFEVSFPARTVAVKRWIRRPVGPIAGLWFVEEARPRRAPSPAAARSS